MITRTEYLRSLLTVEEYHKQLVLHVGAEKESFENRNKIHVKDFIKNNPNMPIRIMNCLHDNCRDRSGWNGRTIKGIEFIEDYTIKRFRKVRGLGDSSWKTFTKLRGY